MFCTQNLLFHKAFDPLSIFGAFIFCNLYEPNWQLHLTMTWKAKNFGVKVTFTLLNGNFVNKKSKI